LSLGKIADAGPLWLETDTKAPHELVTLEGAEGAAGRSRLARDLP